MTLDWGNGNYYGSSANLDPYVFNRPVWTSGWFLPGNPVSDDFSFYKNFLEKTNVKYIVLHKDIPDKYYFPINIEGSPKGQASYAKLNDQISAYPDFSLVTDNKYFKIFKVKASENVSHFKIHSKYVISTADPAVYCS